jgi:hypothetical protein
MAATFEKFVREYFKAIRSEDLDFIKKVYADWLETSGAVPKGQEEQFLKAAFESLKPMANGKLDKTDEFGDFFVGHFKDPEGEFSLTFRKMGDSWIFFNERSNYSRFKRVYAMNYNLSGGKVNVLFNGSRTPLIYEIQGSGFVSLINSVLVPGENEITLEPAGGEVSGSLQISSAKEGEILDSAQGDVLNWEGVLKERASLKFKIE